LGALAGAIIGNNSAGHNGLAGALIGGAAGAIAGGTLGNSVDNQRGTLYRSEQEAATTVTVQQPPAMPAPPQEVITVQPGPPGALWVNGYYAFDGYRYVWVGGHWEMPPQGYRIYVAPHWAWRRGSYVYIRGYWR